MLHLLLVVSWTLLPLSHESLPEFNIIVAIPNYADSDATDDTRTVEKELLLVVDAVDRRLRELELPFTLNLKKLGTYCKDETQQPGTSLPTDLVELARQVITSDTDCKRGLTVAVVGYFCKTTLQQLDVMGVGNPDHLGISLIPVNTFLPVYSGRSPPYYYQLFPSVLSYAEALYQLMRESNWTRHGIVFTENHNSFLFDSSQQLIRRLKDRGLGPTMKLFALTNNGKINTKRMVQKIHVSGVRIVYFVLPPIEAGELIFEAYHYGLRWPNYVWMVPEYISDIPINYKRVCPIDHIEGIITFQADLTGNFSRYEDQGDVLFTEKQARGLYDTVLSIAYALNSTLPNLKMLISDGCVKSSQLSKLKVQTKISHAVGKTLLDVIIPGEEDMFSSYHHEGIYSETNIGVYQLRRGAYHKFGNFDSNRNSTTLNTSGMILTTDLLPKENKVPPFGVRVVLAAFLAVCLLLSIANVFLYLCYRNQPEIKATSVGLSMLIHISCFMLMIAAMNEINKNVRVVGMEKMCLIRVWSVYPTLDLIIATLLVKVLRIYHIFNNFATFKRAFSDKTLLLVIALIVIVKIGILTCWTVVDPHSVIEEETYVPSTIPPHYIIIKQCHSKYYFVWIPFVLGYTAILGAILAIVAFKVRKIHRRDFKDTKKINIALFVSASAICIILPMFWILRMEGNTMAIQILLPSLYLSIPFCCQFCIISPKTLPPLRRTLKHVLFPPQPQLQRQRTLTQDKIEFLRKPSLSSRNQ